MRTHEARKHPIRWQEMPDVYDDFEDRLFVPPSLADLECEHGAMPHDGRKPDECRCWS